MAAVLGVPRDLLVRLTTYLGTGVASFGVDVGGLFLLHSVLGVALVIAAPTAFLASFAVNFTLNQRYTFQANRDAYRGQLVRFTILVVFNTAMTTLIVTGLAALGLHYLVAKTISVAVLFVFNYFVLRHWVFRDRSVQGAP
jgi:putative flippase GtrA